MKWLRKLLFPFSLLYWAITSLRNKLFDLGWIRSKTYPIPVICVGNLSTGGTGKSPMIEFLIAALKENWKLAVLSRGYKRCSKGYKEVLVQSTVQETGDEPLQIKRKFPEVVVAVCESRQMGIENLGGKFDVILLDDAYQHRKVKPSFSILLTAFPNLYVDDYILPMGNLRESRSGAKRADIIIVTKCPTALTREEMFEIKKELNPQSSQKVYFSTIGYGKEIINKSGSKPLQYLKNQKFTLVTGIANPRPLVNYLKEKGNEFDHKSFGDHHDFDNSEVKDLELNSIILTTEKDYIRLQPKIKKAELYYLPIETLFLNNSKKDFITQIYGHLEIFSR